MLPEGKKVRVYRKSSFGISTWDIWWEGAAIYYASAVCEGGAQQIRSELVELNKSGRSIDQQIHLQMKSRLSRMMDKGYKSTREEALSGATNQLGLVNPMLAHPIDKVSVPPFEEAHVQIKYDGHRTLVTRRDGAIFAYTRRGKPVLTIDHVLSVLDPVLPEGVTLDGELYIHGQSLQAISSLIKRDQSGSKALVYHIYDIVDSNVFSQRWKFARDIVDPVATPFVHCVPTDRITSLVGAYQHFRKARSEGHEGSMLRLDLAGYEDGKRSAQLLKLKERSDEDFEVVDVKPGKYDIGILVLRLNDRAGTFDCTAPGSVPLKQEILTNKHLYIGRKVTVMFACKTADGIPFHGVADRFVEEL